jgi:hypothetical protein
MQKLRGRTMNWVPLEARVIQRKRCVERQRFPPYSTAMVANRREQTASIAHERRRISLILLVFVDPHPRYERPALTTELPARLGARRRDRAQNAQWQPCLAARAPLAPAPCRPVRIRCVQTEWSEPRRASRQCNLVRKSESMLYHSLPVKSNRALRDPAQRKGRRRFSVFLTVPH